MPVPLRAAREIHIDMNKPDKTREIVDLAQALIRIPSITVGPEERLKEVRQAVNFVTKFLDDNQLEVRFFDGRYSAILASFPTQPGVRQKTGTPVIFAGHVDVVAPEPDDKQFIPRIEGDYLWGRGSADMKTVVATYLVWMKDLVHRGPPYPPVSLLLVSNEENGETEPMGTPHVLEILRNEIGYSPRLIIAGERTGEKGAELWGEICVRNRGAVRFDVVGRGKRGHTGITDNEVDLSERLAKAQHDLMIIMQDHLTLRSEDGWQSQARFPFVKVGTPGVYNIVADHGVLGVEVRPIPRDDVRALIKAVKQYCEDHLFDIQNLSMEPGIACDLENPYLQKLIQAVRQSSQHEPVIGRKLPATSARFAPGGQGVVWGQSGIGPHSSEERHFIPSVLPYYKALTRYAEILME